jgi:uncharacterized protein YdcH (DUF465 family)
MSKIKTPAELMREMEANQQELARLKHRQEQLDHQMTRAKNTLSYLGAKERKMRTHRLVQKGAIIEHHAPETKELSEPEFYALMENILALPEAKGLLDAATANHRSLSHG